MARVSGWGRVEQPKTWGVDCTLLVHANSQQTLLSGTALVRPARFCST
jgi:hypothetical protein